MLGVIKIDKSSIAEKFMKEEKNILVQKYTYGAEGGIYNLLEERNNFSPKRKNDIIVVHEDYRLSKDTAGAYEKIREAFINIIYDYLKDFCEIKKDIESGGHIATSIFEDNCNYAFKTLERNRKEIARFAIHVPLNMDEKETKIFYEYMLNTLDKYRNVRFCLLDQQDRSLDRLVIGRKPREPFSTYEFEVVNLK